MNIKLQRILLGLVFVTGLVAAYCVPRVWQTNVGDVLNAVFFGAITLDWIWLRLIKPKMPTAASTGHHP